MTDEKTHIPSALYGISFHDVTKVELKNVQHRGQHHLRITTDYMGNVETHELILFAKDEVDLAFGRAHDVSHGVAQAESAVEGGAA